MPPMPTRARPCAAMPARVNMPNHEKSARARYTAEAPLRSDGAHASPPQPQRQWRAGAGAASTRNDKHKTGLFPAIPTIFFSSLPPSPLPSPCCPPQAPILLPPVPPEEALQMRIPGEHPLVQCTRLVQAGARVERGKPLGAQHGRRRRAGALAHRRARREGDGRCKGRAWRLKRPRGCGKRGRLGPAPCCPDRLEGRTVAGEQAQRCAGGKKDMKRSPWHASCVAKKRRGGGQWRNLATRRQWDKRGVRGRACRRKEAPLPASGHPQTHRYAC